jgi:LAGLIDADG-like domain
VNPTVLLSRSTTSQEADDTEGSENPIGADDQQGSRRKPLLTPQRLHAEPLDPTSAADVKAYLQGALKDATPSSLHGTHRYGQSDRAWLERIADLLGALGHRSWIYREGRDRNYWIVETSAKFLSVSFDPSSLMGTRPGLSYVRGYFDADGGMPTSSEARLYLQFCQKDRVSLERVHEILRHEGIDSGRIHNPSARVDPDYWRFFVRAKSHQDFLTRVGSWHPRKQAQIRARVKI